MTIIIIGILAAVTLGALQKAQQAADIAKTRALIGKLHTQMMLRYESYRTRRMPITLLPTVVDPYDSTNPYSAYVAARRLATMRLLQRMELPDRWTDIEDGPIGPPTFPRLYDGFVIPAITSAYRARYFDAKTRAENTFGTQEGQRRILANEDAECLYMILTMGSEDDVLGAEQLTPSDIGDIDEDGLPEFHDAWGQPIQFLRWAPGFVSDLQPTANANGLPAPASDRMPDTRHDPFDPLKLQVDAFSLYPLIYSGGIDRQTDIYRVPVDTSGQPLPFHCQQYIYTTGIVVNRLLPSSQRVSMPIPNNPYASLSSTAPYGFGSPFDGDGDGDEGWADNIHNHLIGLR